MNPRKLIFGALAASALTTGAHAGDAMETYEWMSTTRDILAEGVIWNDTLGDGKDRYKSGGFTQSLILPESFFSSSRWIKGHASALELQGRVFVATPDNTSAVTPGDRPYAQYAGVGIYLRTSSRPKTLADRLNLIIETRAGFEIGYQGDPLPLFELQELVHTAGTRMGSLARTPTNTLPSEWLANIEARRTWRMHLEGGRTDLQFAPYVELSLGMRQNSARFGGDIILGSSLEARTWNLEPTTGVLTPGGSRRRDGAHWVAWIGGDLGYIASDALLDGGFGGGGPKVGRKPVTARLRAGMMIEWGSVALGYSLTWLSPEFKGQPSGQLIGAVQLKFEF